MNTRYFLMLAPALIAAAPAGPVQLTSTAKVEKVVTVNGQQQTVLRAPKPVVPGDHLLFQTDYRNTGVKPLTDFVITNPIPNGVVFTGQTSGGAVFSVDGGKSFGPLATLKVRGPQGMRPAQAQDVNQIRWTIATIAPGGAGSVQYKGIVQ